MNPIAALEGARAVDVGRVFPMLFGYTNYARAGFRSHRLRFANMPDIAGHGLGGSELGGAGIAVTASCRDQARAIAYCYWIAGEQCQKGLYFEAGGQPANATAWDDPELNGVTGDFFRATRSTLESAWLRPRRQNYPSFHAAAGHVIHRYLRESRTEEATIAELINLYEKVVGGD